MIFLIFSGTVVSCPVYMYSRTATWYIIGLGNPSSCDGTRHSIGKEAVCALSCRYGEGVVEYAGKIQLRKGFVCNRNVRFVTSDGYMNESGNDLSPVLQTYHLQRSSPSVPPLVLIHDDVDLPFGRLRFSYNRGDGGHKGVISVMETLHSMDMIRLRIGIGRGNGDTPIETFVLEPFTGSEGPVVQDMIKNSIPRGIETLIESANKGNSGRYTPPSLG